MCGLTTSGPGRDHLGMGDEQMIFPRSPLERMNGWMHLPRLVDKIRLNEAGRLGADYLANFLVKGFDQRWLAAAEIESEALVKVVKESSTDGEVCDWVSRNVRNTEGEKERFNEFLAHYGREAILSTPKRAASDRDANRVLLPPRKRDGVLPVPFAF